MSTVCSNEEINVETEISLPKRQLGKSGVSMFAKRQRTGECGANMKETCHTSENETESSPMVNQTSHTQSQPGEARACTAKLQAKTEKRSFQSTWKISYPWLEFNTLTKKISCRICITAGVENSFTRGTTAKIDNIKKHLDSKGNFYPLIC